MLKAIIADDEQLEREGIKNNIPWTELDIEVIGVYSNGKDAYNAVISDSPNIVLSDIRMPKLNGVELARKIRENTPAVKVLLLSGYDSFKYAQEAIEANVFKYILKPYTISELKEAIDGAAKACRAEDDKQKEELYIREKIKESLPVLRQKFYSDLLNGNYDDESKINDRIDFLDAPLCYSGSYAVNLVDIDNNTDAEAYQSHILSMKVADEINETLKNTRGVCVNISDNIFAVINSFPADEKNARDANIDILNNLLNRLNDKFTFDITIGAGGLTNSLVLLKSSLNEAYEAIAYKYNIGADVIISYGDIDVIKNGVRELDVVTNGHIDKLIASLKHGDRDGVFEQVNNIFKAFDIYRADTIYSRNIIVDLINAISKCLWTMDIEIEDIFGVKTNLMEKLISFDISFDIKYWVKNILEAVVDYIDQKSNTKNKNIINRITEIIEADFSKNLTIADIASAVFLSAGYAARLFKKETGRSIMEYVVETRIEKAKEMLKNPGIKVYEASNGVGYENVPYFSTLFKRLEGITPKEYQERYGK